MRGVLGNRHPYRDPFRQLVYKKEHLKLLQPSAEWLRFGTYEGRPGLSSK